MFKHSKNRTLPAYVAIQNPFQDLPIVIHNKSSAWLPAWPATLYWSKSNHINFPIDTHSCPREKHHCQPERHSWQRFHFLRSSTRQKNGSKVQKSHPKQIYDSQRPTESTGGDKFLEPNIVSCLCGTIWAVVSLPRTALRPGEVVLISWTAWLTLAWELGLCNKLDNRFGNVANEGQLGNFTTSDQIWEDCVWLELGRLSRARLVQVQSLAISCIPLRNR